MTTIRTFSFFVACLLGLVSASYADSFAAIPPLTDRVVDTTGSFSRSDIAALDAKLSSLEQAKGAQLAVLIVSTTAPEAIEQYSIRVVESWKLGRKKVDDGVLLLIALKDHTYRMEIGYGLEGALPDALSKRILDEVLRPALRSNDLVGGVNATVDAITKVISGEELPALDVSHQSQNSGGDVNGGVMLLVMGGFFLAFLLRGVFGRTIASLIAAIAALLLGILLIKVISGVIAFFFIFVYGVLGGSSGVFLGGGGFRGGGGDSGFSGGGGSFGGGGASGSW